MRDLAKIRASVKRWGPRVATSFTGAACGVGAVTVVRLTLAALDAGHALLVAALASAAFANAAVWWMWGRHKTADVHAARAQRQAWIKQADAWEVEAVRQHAEVVRLAAENDQLRRAEVSHLPAKQTGDEQ